jgi:hypothetical protein
MMRPPPIIFNPWIAFIGTISGIISTPLAVFLAFYTIRTPDLTYAVYPLRTPVLQSGLAAGLRVLHNNEEIKGNVTAVQIAIWNNGREPIVREKILTPVKIVTRPPVPILEATIRTQSRKEIEFSLDNRSLKEGVVSVSWKILEGADGATVQLIYAGPLETKIDLEGVLVDQRTIAPAFYPYVPGQFTKISFFLGIITFWMVFGFIIWMVYQVSPKTWWGKIIASCALIGGGYMAVYVPYMWYITAEPPFGF